MRVDNQTVRLRKPHPCGSSEFTLIQMGPEVVLRCAGCQAVVRLQRKKYERAVKRAVSRSQESGALSDDAGGKRSVEKPHKTPRNGSS